MLQILMKLLSVLVCFVLMVSGSFSINQESRVESPVYEPEIEPAVDEDLPSEAWGLYEDFEAEVEEAGAYDNSLAAKEAYGAAYEAAPVSDSYWRYGAYEDIGNEKYESREENPYKLTAMEPLSTFAADVDTASYANVRRMIEDGWSADEIYTDAVRPEEFVNYFSYHLEDPEDGEKFGVTTKIGRCPWNSEHDLFFIGMKTKDIDLSEIPDQNLVFLIDVSGSMIDENKLPLLKKSFLQLLDQLDENDTVSIVTYANGVETVLDGVKCDDKDVIRDAVNGLEAEGGTYGEGGIQRAYEIAERNFLENGNNRVILATDGDLNIGISEPDQLEKLVAEKKDSGVYLSVLGFGMYNYRDDNMERLADCGNGNYAYIDSLLEAKKVLVEEMGSTLLTVADDVKLQVEFNPAKVNAYRLIGYENRLMDAVDFRDDAKDAGEIGAGHSVVALYELIPEGSKEAVALKYQKSENTGDAEDVSSEYATVYIRYKEPGEQEAKESEYPVAEGAYMENPDDDFRFAAAAAELALILQDSDEKGDASLEHLSGLLKDMPLEDEYKEEFRYLVRRLQGQDY